MFKRNKLLSYYFHVIKTSQHYTCMTSRAMDRAKSIGDGLCGANIFNLSNQTFIYWNKKIKGIDIFVIYQINLKTNPNTWNQNAYIISEGILYFIV